MSDMKTAVMLAQLIIEGPQMCGQRGATERPGGLEQLGVEHKDGGDGVGFMGRSGEGWVVSESQVSTEPDQMVG